MTKYLNIFCLITFLTGTKSFATTWDEPWADKVIKQSTSFVLAKIISNDPENGIKIKVIKILGGIMLPDALLINNFYALTLCSSSGDHGAEFDIETVDSCYFFLNQNDKGQFCIATPTTGFDYVNDGLVMATYRHSYHQASVPVSIYEKTMTAIFNNYHNLSYDKIAIEKFVVEYLNKAPAGFEENEINTFFLQHVALESVYHLKLNIKESLVLPFLNDKDNFHNQVSAARAMDAFKTETSKQELFKTISDTTKRNFVRVLCVWTLSDFHPKELKTELLMLEKSASDESDGFGGNIMDPRVCTNIPTLKQALKELADKL